MLLNAGVVAGTAHNRPTIVLDFRYLACLVLLSDTGSAVHSVILACLLSET